MIRIFPGAVLTFVLLTPTPAGASRFAQPLDPQKAITQLLHDVWQYEEGLPQNTVHSIIQSSEGYLWLGTEEGLARFDGKSFTVFDDGNTVAFENGHNVLSLKEGPSGTIWIGTEGGGVLFYKGGSVHKFIPTSEFPSLRVNAIAVDPGGTLYLGTSKRGLLVCEAEECRKYDSASGLPGDLVQSLVWQDRGKLWIGTDSGLAELNTLTPSDPVQLPALAGTFIQNLYVDHQARLWISTHDGLTRIADKKLIRLSSKDGWPDDTVWSMLEDGSGSMWFGLDHKGLARYNSGRFDTYSPDEGLSNGRVLSLLEDREGSVWIGTGGGGLNRLRDGAFTTWSEQEGLASNAVSTIFEDEDGAVLVGTFGGGVSKLFDDQISTISTRSGLSSDVVTSIAGAPNGAYWIGTVDAGLNLWRGKRLRIYSRTNGLASDAVYALYTSYDGRLWVGTDAGLSVIDGYRIKTYTTADGLSGNSVTAIAEGSNGEIWIGTYENGLNLFNNGRFTSFTTESGLGSNTISALHRDSEGVLWIGTYGGGLSRLKDDRFVTVSQPQGLFDDKIFQILEDDDGNLWMGCNRGIFTVSKREIDALIAGRIRRITSTVYGTDDGLRRREVNGGVQPAGWRGRDGRLWFPTISGVAVVDPSNLRRNDTIPPVVIEKVLLDDSSADLTRAVSVPPGTKRIEIDYAGLSLVDPDAVSYRYRLEGYENLWVNAGSETSATYTHLAPGDYTFSVRASNNDGVWNETGASISVSIEPFFYQTTLFWLLVGIILVGLVVTGHWFRVRSLRRRQRHLEDDVASRTRDFKAATVELETTTEELRASLKQKDVLLREVHHRVKNNLQMISSLLRLQSRQVSDEATKKLFDECRDRIYSISMIHERVYRSDNLAEMDFSGYLYGITEQLLLSYNAEKNNIVLRINCTIGHLDVDRAISCGLIVTELVSNALKHAFPDPVEGGTIHLDLQCEDQRYRLSVSDNGRGLQMDYADHSETALGLNLVRGLVARLGGTFTVAETKMDGSSGAKFDILFPVVPFHGQVPDREETEKVA